MPNLTKQALEAIRKEAFDSGFFQGRAQGMREMEQRFAAKAPEREAAVKLINAVGQTLDTQARLVQGLASVLDNAPR